MAGESETQRFDTPESFRAWLSEHHASSPGLWLTFAKKGSPLTTVTYAEALEAALAYGWIDGQVRGIDADAYLQRFTPRRPQSPWSLRNRRAAEALIAEGTMEPSGLAEVERARADGRWERAYAGQRTADQHPDFLAALEENAAAAAFYAQLDSHNRYAIYYRIQDAKRADTRARRIAQFVDKLARGEKFHD